MRSSSPSRSPASSVSIAGGLLERLKAQRAAHVSTETVHPPRQSASANESGQSTAPASPKSEPKGARVSTVLATGAPSSREVQRSDRYPPAGQPNAPLARPGATLITSPPRPTSGVCSSVLSSPDGEEFDHAFHPLSDVMCVTPTLGDDLALTSSWIIARREQSERSSLSTWQSQSGINRRAPTSPPDAQSNRSLQFSPSTTDPWTRASRREGHNGTTQAPAAAREGQRSASPSSWSPAGLPVAAAADFDRGSDDFPVYRMDATARLIGRSESSASSIFSDTARNAARCAESAFERSHTPKASSAPSSSGRVSPVRRVSPEVARRAAIFGLVRSSSPPLAPVPLPSAIHTASAQRAYDGEGAESTLDALPSAAWAPSPRSFSTDHEHLREAKPADTSTHRTRAAQPLFMAPDRPIKHEVRHRGRKSWALMLTRTQTHRERYSRSKKDVNRSVDTASSLMKRSNTGRPTRAAPSNGRSPSRLPSVSRSNSSPPYKPSTSRCVPLRCA